MPGDVYKRLFERATEQYGVSVQRTTWLTVVPSASNAVPHDKSTACSVDGASCSLA